MMQIQTIDEINIIYTYSTGTIIKEDMDKLLPILK